MLRAAHVAATHPAELDAPLSDDQFQRFASTLSTLIWRLSASGARLIAPRWAEITGRPIGELQNRGWLRTIHVDDRDSVVAELRTALAYGTHFQADFRLLLCDGSAHWFRARGEPVRGRQEEITGFIGVSSNIDDQKRAELALAENERRLRLVIELARVGTIDHDLVTGKLQLGPNARRLCGFSLDAEITFEQFKRRVHPEDLALFRQVAARAMAPDSDGVVDLPFRVLTLRGESVWLNARGTYLFEGEGEHRHPVRFIGVAGHMSGRMRELAERGLMSAIVTSSSDAIVAVTPQGVVTHWNPAAERIFGYRASEMVGQPIFNLVPPAELANCSKHIADVLSGALVESYTGRRCTRADLEIEMSITLSRVLDEAGKVVGISAIMRDIREQRRLEAEAARGKLMRAVGELASSVSHDLNNTLTVLLSGLELAEQLPNLPSEMCDQFHGMRDSCYESARLIRQLLGVARRHAADHESFAVDAALLESMATRIGPSQANTVVQSPSRPDGRVAGGPSAMAKTVTL